MSRRAELVRLGLRWFVKRKIGPATTLQRAGHARRVSWSARG